MSLGKALHIIYFFPSLQTCCCVPYPSSFSSFHFHPLICSISLSPVSIKFLPQRRHTLPYDLRSFHPVNDEKIIPQENVPSIGAKARAYSFAN
ncbi:hypothetical protein BJ912DRAFT_126643 [Pholiota molesta]|nr:hypothetical protein BJ912DRAFT_126643 [Pholiota molesta]